MTLKFQNHNQEPILVSNIKQRGYIATVAKWGNCPTMRSSRDCWERKPRSQFYQAVYYINICIHKYIYCDGYINVDMLRWCNSVDLITTHIICIHLTLHFLPFTLILNKATQSFTKNASIRQHLRNFVLIRFNLDRNCCKFGVVTVATEPVRGSVSTCAR